MSQGLELFYCMAAWWSSKFEASPCSWTSAVGRCLCRGLNYFLVIPDWTSQLLLWGGHEGQGSFSVRGLSWRGVGRGGHVRRADVSSQNSALAGQGLPTPPSDISRFSWLQGGWRMVQGWIWDPESLLKLYFLTS